MLLANNFESLEHIDIRVWIKHHTRGEVEVEITSPNGITSVLARKRPGDRATTGYPGWRFMSVKHWGENPVGNWTIKVSDQNTPDTSNGTFLGWNMKFWGTTIDPSKAMKYEVPLVENVLPVHVVPPVFPTSTSSTVLSKPTAHLPGDHSIAPGENVNPAFPSATPLSSSTAHPTADVGWFPSLSNLVVNQKWFFGAIGAVALFGIGIGTFFWLRRKARVTDYITIPAGDDMSMSAIASARRSGIIPGGSRPTRELYDAFGEVSDEDDDDDERTASRGTLTHEGVPGTFGFHSGFLDDDEPPTARGNHAAYRDELDSSHNRRNASASPSGSGESWEHASP